jgi:hypothetical protein
MPLALNNKKKHAQSADFYGFLLKHVISRTLFHTWDSSPSRCLLLIRDDILDKGSF